MAQIFHPSMNTISRVTIFGFLFFVAGALVLGNFIARSPYATQATVIKDQPVPFSHAHHVGDAGLDCRYCHTSVETSSHAGLPPSKTCMNCHSQLWTESAMLEPVRESYKTGEPLEWTRVHDLPDFVYFNHAIHVNKGVACATCHGDVSKMPLMYREHTLHMEWCLSCHRNPEDFVQPGNTVFNVGKDAWKNNSEQDNKDLAAWLENHSVDKKTNCTTCHR